MVHSVRSAVSVETEKKVLRLLLEPDTARQCWPLSNSNEQTQASSSNSYVHQKINTKLRLAKFDELLKNKHHPPAEHTVALMKGRLLKWALELGLLC